jgi:hypothetical protein
MPNIELATWTGSVEGVRVNGDSVRGDALVMIVVVKLGSRRVEMSVYDAEHPIMVRLSRRAAAALGAALARAAGAEP